MYLYCNIIIQCVSAVVQCILYSELCVAPNLGCGAFIVHVGDNREIVHFVGVLVIYPLSLSLSLSHTHTQWLGIKSTIC